MKFTEYHTHYMILPFRCPLTCQNCHLNCKLEVTPDNKALFFHYRGTLVPKVISANFFQLLLNPSAHRFVCRDFGYSKLLPHLPYRLLLRKREFCHYTYYLILFCSLYHLFCLTPAISHHSELKFLHFTC